jgi:hypothetical protein
MESGFTNMHYSNGVTLVEKFYDNGILTPRTFTAVTMITRVFHLKYIKLIYVIKYIETSLELINK